MQQQQQSNVVVVSAGGLPPQPAPMQWVVRPPPVVTSFAGFQAVGLGATLVIAGSLSVIFNIVDVSIMTNGFFTLGFVAHGFWCGIMCIIAGSIGIGAGKVKSRCMIHGFNVLCIISACMCAAQLALGILGAVLYGQPYCYSYRYYYYSSYNYNYRYNNYSGLCDTTTAMESLLAILGFVQGVASIWGSAICCRAACCCDCCLATPPQPMMLVGNGAGMAVVSQQQQQYPMSAYPPPQQYYPPYQPGQNAYMPLQSPPQPYPQYNNQPMANARF